jgi:hypothetical protein
MGKKLTPGRMGLFEFAHSLGFPHPDLMLDKMSARQYIELRTYFRVKNIKVEQGMAEAEESNTMQFLARKMAQQEAE